MTIRRRAGRTPRVLPSWRAPPRGVQRVPGRRQLDAEPAVGLPLKRAGNRSLAANFDAGDVAQAHRRAVADWRAGRSCRTLPAWRAARSPAPWRRPAGRGLAAASCRTRPGRSGLIALTTSTAVSLRPTILSGSIQIRIAPRRIDLGLADAGDAADFAHYVRVQVVAEVDARRAAVGRRRGRGRRAATPS